MTNEILNESISALHASLVEGLRAFIAKLVSDSKPDIELGRKSLQQCALLYPLVPSESRPKWLCALNGFEAKEIQLRDNLQKFAAFVIQKLAEIASPITLGDDALYDFDAIFSEVRDEKHIPDVFDNLVQRLGEIIAQDVIDVKTVEEALARLKALLQRNRRGSLTAILISMHYGRFVLKAFGGTLSANKYIKPSVDAFREEFEKAERLVKEANEVTKQQAIRRLVNERRLEGYLQQHEVAPELIAGYLPPPEAQQDDTEPGQNRE